MYRMFFWHGLRLSTAVSLATPSGLIFVSVFRAKVISFCVERESIVQFTPKLPVHARIYEPLVHI